MSSVGRNVQLAVNEKTGAVSGLLMKPPGARALVVLAHGAGAGMRHPFMEDLAARLAQRCIATLRYQFPFMERRMKRPDTAAVMAETVRAAVAAAGTHAGTLPLFAGGKSMGGRMTSLAAAKKPLDGVRGLLFFGFPLHAAGRPGAERGQHLLDVPIPMLFLQGSRDALADLKLLQPLCQRLGKRAELFIVQGGDHSFHMLKRSGRSDDGVFNEMADKVASWIQSR